MKGGWKGVQGCPLTPGPLPQASSWGHLLLQVSPPPQTPSPPPPSLSVTLLNTWGRGAAAWETEGRESWQSGRHFSKQQTAWPGPPAPAICPAATTAHKSQRVLVLTPSTGPWARASLLGPPRAREHLIHDNSGTAGPAALPSGGCRPSTPSHRPDPLLGSPGWSWGALPGVEAPSISPITHRTRETRLGDRSPVWGPASTSRAGTTEGPMNKAANSDLNHETNKQAPRGGHMDGCGPRQVRLSPRNAPEPD